MSTQKVKFVLAAEIVADATDGLLLGEFNNWDKESGFSLKKAKDGSMHATVTLEAGRSYQYRYLLDGGRWENDHRADGYFQVEGHDVYNCVINVPAAEASVAKAAKPASNAQPKKAGKKIELPSSSAEGKAPVKSKTATKSGTAEKQLKAPAKTASKAAAAKPEAKVSGKTKAEKTAKKPSGSSKAK